MSFWRNLFGPKNSSAAIAKERLKIIFAHERLGDAGKPFLPQLKSEILAVVAKYCAIDLEQIQVHLENRGQFEVLEVNVILPENAANPKELREKPSELDHPEKEAAKEPFAKEPRKSP